MNFRHLLGCDTIADSPKGLSFITLRIHKLETKLEKCWKKVIGSLLTSLEILHQGGHLRQKCVKRGFLIL